ncbi:MAG: hypothetical protein ACI8XY_000432, partial [bacterium]
TKKITPSKTPSIIENSTFSSFFSDLKLLSQFLVFFKTKKEPLKAAL